MLYAYVLVVCVLRMRTRRLENVLVIKSGCSIIACSSREFVKNLPAPSVARNRFPIGAWLTVVSR